MCRRRRKRALNYTETATKQTQTKKTKRKRKRNCCTRCCFGICRWFCNRIKRRIRRKLFGPPKLDDIQAMDVNLDGVKDLIPEDQIKTEMNKYSVMTIFKNNKKAKLNISLSHLDLIEGLEADDLKKKYSIKGSKGELLEQMVDDYKKGNISSTGLSDKSKFDFKKLDKGRINEMLDTYKAQKLSSKVSLKYLNVNKLKRKHSLTSSKEKILKNVIEDYKKGKISNSALVELQRLRSKQLSKTEFNKILDAYGTKRAKKKSKLFPGLSKISELKTAIGDVVPFSF